jgi:hypothetical protein
MVDAMFEGDGGAVESFDLRKHPEFKPVLEGFCVGTHERGDRCLRPLERSKAGRWAVCRRCALAYRVLPGNDDEAVVYRRALPR